MTGIEFASFVQYTDTKISQFEGLDGLTQDCEINKQNLQTDTLKL